MARGSAFLGVLAVLALLAAPVLADVEVCLSMSDSSTALPLHRRARSCIAVRTSTHSTTARSSSQSDATHHLFSLPSQKDGDVWVLHDKDFDKYVKNEKIILVRADSMLDVRFLRSLRPEMIWRCLGDSRECSTLV